MYFLGFPAAGHCGKNKRGYKKRSGAMVELLEIK
jgi:hypothetical protein